MKLLIPLLLVLAACSSAPQTFEGAGSYPDLEPGDTIQLDDFSLEYTSYEDKGLFTIFVPGQEPRTIESCEQGSWDFTQLYAGYMLAYNSDGSSKCAVEVFERVSAQREENGAAPFYTNEGILCEEIFVGYRYEEKNTNPYTITTFDTTTGMRSGTFAQPGMPVPGCPQVVIQETTDDYVVFAAVEN